MGDVEGRVNGLYPYPTGKQASVWYTRDPCPVFARQLHAPFSTASLINCLQGLVSPTLILS